LPEPLLTAIVTERDCAVVILFDAGVTDIVGVNRTIVTVAVPIPEE
jgi:hypothetical protein